MNNLYGPTDTKFKCDVLIRDGKKKATKIGNGWNKLCKDNGFHGGDRLMFKFVDMTNIKCNEGFKNIVDK